MANVIKPKRTNTAGNTPTTSNLASGELGVNMADQKTYINNGTSIVQIGAGNLNGLGDVAIVSPTNNQALTYNSTTGKWINSTSAGAGDVAGPASATDNALARFDGTTGKLIQNSVATLSDAGAMDVPNITVDYTQYDTAATVTSAVGRMNWDSGNGSLSLGLKNGNVDLKLGEQEYAYCFNDTGVAITKGQVVYINGAQGNRVSVLLAIATGDSTSGTTIGLVAESIAIGAEGWVQISGPIYKMNTLGLTAGAPIYLSPTVAGGYTTTKPVAPQHLVTLGFVSRVDNIVGSIFIKVDNGYELDELHNVLITTPVSGNTLVYDAVTGVWENASLTSGTGISITNGPGSISIANAGVTSISGGTTGLTPASATTGNVTLAGTLGTANGGTGLTSFALNGIPYANTTTTLNTGSALGFDGNNLLVGTTITPTGSGKISANSGYTAPNNAAGAGTTLSILGSTGTGQANATGGNGFIQLMGAGGTSTWTTFVGGLSPRRRGGINLQAGTSQADAGGTYVNGSTIDIRGSSGTNNGTLAGQGSAILLASGSTTKIDTFLSSGSTITLSGAAVTSGGSVSISSGTFNVNGSVVTGNASVSVNGGNTSNAGSASLNSGTYNGGTFSNGGASITAGGGNATSTGSITLTLNNASAGSTRGRVIIDGCTVGSGVVSGNAILGVDALLSVTSANENVAIGQQASRNLTTGTSNVAIGRDTLLAGISAEQNIAIGPYALTSLNSGYRNIAIGYGSAQNNTAGFENTLIGVSAQGLSALSYYNSVAVGTRALYKCDGNNNTALGHEAGYDLTSGSDNVFVGRGSGQNANTNLFCVYVGARTSSAGSREQEVVIAGTDSTITGKGSNTFFAYANAGGGVGGAYYNGANTTTWSTISDERIKTNFVPVTNGLAIVTALEPTEFNYIIGGKHEVGFKAQQYMTVLPEQVGKNAASPEEKKLVGEDEIYGITRNLDPYFVSAIKTLASQVEQLKTEINLLKGNSNA